MKKLNIINKTINQCISIITKNTTLNMSKPNTIDDKSKTALVSAEADVDNDEVKKSQKRIEFYKDLVSKVMEEDYQKHVIFDNMEEHEWYDAVLEARCHVVQIALFGNTRDKIVITPKHLGYDFDYIWVDKVEVMVIGMIMSDMGYALANMYTVYLVKVSGSCKGYLSTQYWQMQECGVYDQKMNSDLVLFVKVKR